MKRTFLRILPLAVAVLFATSCSKDENNDNAVVNNGQETVQTKTLPISITVNQKSLSKLGCTGDMGEALQPIFEAGDKLAIYNGASLLKELAVTADNISNDGKTATFEGEIDAEGLVDGQTVLTATIGTPIDAAQTAESREDAVKTGCYQTAEFTYSSAGNEIQLEEQNAYIEVVWTNKGGATVPFTIAGEPVNLTLNEQGQGWIVLPAEQSVTCAALGITEAKTTAKGNIYGISRKFVPEGYVDLGIVDKNGKDVYWAVSNTYDGKAWSELTDVDKIPMPTKDDFVDLWNKCYWQKGNDGTNDGFYVFKPYADTDKNTNNSSNHEYSTTSGDPYIFLPAHVSNYYGHFLSSTYAYKEIAYGDEFEYVYCLSFDISGGASDVDPSRTKDVKDPNVLVRLVWRSN